MDDLVDFLPPAVVAAQDRPVLVGDLGPGGDDLPHERPEATHVLLGQGALVGVGEVPVQEGAQVGVQAVPVEPGGLLELRVVGKHPPMLRLPGLPGRQVDGPGHSLSKTN